MTAISTNFDLAQSETQFINPYSPAGKAASEKAQQYMAASGMFMPSLLQAPTPASNVGVTNSTASANSGSSAELSSVQTVNRAAPMSQEMADVYKNMFAVSQNLSQPNQQQV